MSAIKTLRGPQQLLFRLIILMPMKPRQCQIGSCVYCNMEMERDFMVEVFPGVWRLKVITPGSLELILPRNSCWLIQAAPCNCKEQIRMVEERQYPLFLRRL